MRKVFIIGAHRSGTSKLAAYFKEELEFAGYGESHVYRMLSYAQDGRRDIISDIPKDAFEVNRIGFGPIMRSMTRSLDRLVSQHHGDADRFDKTPGWRMIQAAPLVHRYVKESTFIHLQRNGISNVRSNMRLWPDRTFEDACQMWAACMNAYEKARPRLGKRLLELDMNDLIQRPWESHCRIMDHLEMESPLSQDQVEEYFGRGSTTSTAALDTTGVPPRLQDQPWTDAQKAQFIKICGPAMDRMGYPYR